MELSNPSYVLTRRDTNVLRKATRRHKYILGFGLQYIAQLNFYVFPATKQRC